MTSIEELQKEVELIKQRNERVEAAKAWETSWSRKLAIAALTYVIIVVVFMIAKLDNPFKNAVVPAVAFLLSGLSLSLIKKWWLNTIYVSTQEKNRLR